MRSRAARGRQLPGGQSHPTPVQCQALALEWAEGHEGEWEGEVSSQASSQALVWWAGWEDRGQGQRREKNKGVRMEELAPADL